MKHRALLPLLALAAVGCEPPLFKPDPTPGGPAGVLEGSVTYSGPLPCTEMGHVVGAGVILAFDVRALPPPDGLGSGAASVNTVPGDLLFAGLLDQLTFNDDGSRWCPSFDAEPVTVTAPWVLSPMLAGAYQVRGFYDHDGDFDPAFKISNLPSKGDIGGGAVANVTDVLLGAAPIYQVIEVGTKQDDGTWTMPPDGVYVPGISVAFALSIPVERPLFHFSEVKNQTKYDAGDPLSPKFPSDFQIATFNLATPTATENSFIRFRLSAGLPQTELDHDGDANGTPDAAESPFNFPVVNPAATMFVTRQDTNRDGVIDAEDHIPETSAVKSLFPTAVFAKLASPLATQKGPAVLLQAVTLRENLIGTATAPDDLVAFEPSVVIALRPSAVCLPADPAAPAILLISNPNDESGNPILSDLETVGASLEKQLGRPVEARIGCIPEGQYALNVVYPTGQAWTVPNEAGVCAASEPLSADGLSCGARAHFSSQEVVLTVTAPLDPTYCVANPTPAECLLPPE